MNNGTVSKRILSEREWADEEIEDLLPTIKCLEYSGSSKQDYIARVMIRKSNCPTKERFVSAVECEDEIIIPLESVLTGYLVRFGNSYKLIDHPTPKSEEVWVSEEGFYDC